MIKTPSEDRSVSIGFGPCDHAECKPPFDSQAAKSMTSLEVREKYPRFYGECPNCKGMVIAYASFEHYISGDG